MYTVVYVRSLIDKDEMQDTKENLSEVKEFPIPKGIKTLLGSRSLANYFSRHIKSLATLLAKATKEVGNKHAKTKKFYSQTKSFKNFAMCIELFKVVIHPLWYRR